MSRLDKLKERHNQQASKLGMNTSTEDTPDKQRLMQLKIVKKSHLILI